MDTFELIHFFSAETKVSLELPIGWEEADTDAGTAIYTYDLDDEADEADEEVSAVALSPKYIVRIIGLPSAHPNAYQRLAQTLREQPRAGQEGLTHSEIEVDGQPAVLDVWVYDDAEAQRRVVHYQVFVQIDQIVCSLTGIAEDAQRARWLPDFEIATQSVRFIPV